MLTRPVRVRQRGGKAHGEAIYLTTRSTCTKARTGKPAVPEVHEIAPPPGTSVDTPSELKMSRAIVRTWPPVSVHDKVNEQNCPLEMPRSRVKGPRVRLL